MASSSYREHVRDLVELVLFTRPGERVMRPDFGTPIPEVVFERPTHDVLSNVQFLVQTSLQRFMSDLIAVENIEVRSVENRIEIALSYVLLPMQERVEEVFTP